MKITGKSFGKYASELKKFLDEEGIVTAGCLEKHLWRRVRIKDEDSHFITVNYVPHEDGEKSFAVNYIITRPNEIYLVIPLEVRINPESNYSTIVARLDSRIDGYNIFYMNSSNILQDKVIKGSDVEGIKEELSSLCESFAYLN